jgi:hypothetical protein
MFHLRRLLSPARPVAKLPEDSPRPTYRQGDVLLRRVEAAPSGSAVARENGRLILALGEATGHAHAITDESATLIRSSDGSTFLRLDAPAVVSHEEHAPLALPAGDYEVVLQREHFYGPERRDAANTWTRVAD